MQLPVIALIGRPNVGKSTLFNCLTRTKDALVIDFPGVTRDRKFGVGRVGPAPYIVIDTGGIGEKMQDIDLEMSSQSWKAVAEADCVVFMVDGREGLTAADHYIAKRLREGGKPVWLAVNKTDGVDPYVAISDFFTLGFKHVLPMAAGQGKGSGVKSFITALLTDLLGLNPDEEEPAEPEVIEMPTEDNVEALDALAEPVRPRSIRVTISGRPNVGKSTLVNRLLGEERVVVFDEPGTTRDSIAIDFERHGVPYTLVDTAGVRKNKSAMDTIEKFSVVKSLQSIQDSVVVILVIDAVTGILDQDLSLLQYALEAGKAVVIAINKWDGLTEEHKHDVKAELERRLNFIDYLDILFISAKHGTNVGHLYQSVEDAFESATRNMPTALLTRVLQSAVETHQPPLVNGRRIKLRYAHCGGHNPPTIVIHGNQTDKLPKHYIKFLENFYRKSLKLVGTPVLISTKSSENPFAGKRNPLTPRQQYKRDRLIRHRKKSK